MTNEEIVKLIQSGVNQRCNMQLLYEQNIGFINSIVKRYSYVCHASNRHTRKLNEIHKETSSIGVIEFDELLQEAFMGLCNAVKGYDASMECKFLTYAEDWIRQAVRRYLDNCGNTIRIPPHMQALIGQYNKIQRHFMGKYDRNATAAEVADILYLSVKDVKKLEKFMFQSSAPVSLNSPLTADDESGITIADSIPDTTTNIEEQVIEEIVNEEVSKVWTEIERVLKNPTMKDVILYQFRDNMTLKEIADKIGMTSESVRHYKNKGLRRLRSDSRTKRLLAMIA